MRRRIHEAATAHLARFGYHRTSIGKVVEAAAVSQGALQHHFPSKHDLMASTAEYLLARSVKWFARAKLDLARDRNAFATVVRRSWREQFRSADYAALLEILAAARTDASLRKRVAPALERWRSDIERELAALLSAGGGAARDLEAVLTISRAMMTGLLVHDGLLGDESRMEAVIETFIDLAAPKPQGSRNA